MLQILEPQDAGGVAGHAPVATGREADTADLGTIGQTGTLELLGEETAAEGLKPLLDNLFDEGQAIEMLAFRWASDRIAQCPDGGIVAFITNGSWLDGNAQDGMRKCMAEEFDKIYVYNLRGNQRTSGELSRKEGGKIFGSGSRPPHYHHHFSEESKK